MILILLV